MRTLDTLSTARYSWTLVDSPRDLATRPVHDVGALGPSRLILMKKVRDVWQTHDRLTSSIKALNIDGKYPSSYILGWIIEIWEHTRLPCFAFTP